MKGLVVPMLNGQLIADTSTDPNHPGIYVEFVCNNIIGYFNPCVLIEQEPEGGVRALLWNNPESEDFQLEYKLYPEIESQVKEINEENKLIVPINSGILVATAENSGILIELITDRDWGPKVLVNQDENNIQVKVWKTPYLEQESDKVLLYTAPQTGMSIRTLIQELQEIKKNILMQS